MSRLHRVLVSAALVVLCALVSPLSAQQSVADRFDYKGDVFFQGFYLARDLPLERQTKALCRDTTTTPATGKRCREEEDFYRMRLRLNLAFRASPYAEILYGLEVGFLTFGRENKDATTGKAQDFGPGSGGRGAGKTNLETRELLLRLHTKEDKLSLNLGVFNFSTPKGIVMATSGAGLKFTADITSLSSSVEAVYVRSIDNSRVDDDSNGYSDDNFAEVNAGTATWKYNGIRSLRTELYGAYYYDNDPTANDPTDSVQETSRVYWSGLFVQYQGGRWKVILHGILNGGHFERPFAVQPPNSYWLASFPELKSIDDQRKTGETAGTLRPLRRKYPIEAQAGQAEVSFRLADGYRLAAVAAAGSGRFPGDVEPDGGLAALRKDQFRALGSFQFSDIAVDSSGGYSAISSGRLTGIYARGVTLTAQLSSTLEGEVGYYTIDLIHTPTIERNQFYRRGERIDRTNNYFGQEVNLKLSWRAFADFLVEGRASIFDAGAAYKVVRDVEYGDKLSEVSVAVSQKF